MIKAHAEVQREPQAQVRRRVNLIRSTLDVTSFSVAGVIIPGDDCSKGPDFNQFSDKGWNDNN